ncbi:MAG: hypothetical protein CL398_07990 [Acidiferrobacteraceae bacterium]|nr:hypothetical protein [Acidiferrobacteraceae bacterium]
MPLFRSFSRRLILTILLLLSLTVITEYFGRKSDASEAFGGTLALYRKTNHLHSVDQEFRLFGIEIIRYSAKCIANGITWNCGHKAHEAISFILQNIQPYCLPVTQTVSSLELSELYECFIQDRSLNAELVKNGWALSSTAVNSPYQLEELHAQRNKDGIFRGGFAPPNEWRPQYTPMPTNCGICGERHNSKLRTYQKLKKNR